ncbi:hypothetical protein L6E12_08075 [Actinokineospora sp. PR83]|uniref:hypothetical protein n=1 Tax=Actinokineospora sp. PR83 TaxID=2884908 RepID=UPI001F329F77|nr:hypothetical protein [Actinokineospora sp. PR83]MCG8915743.1 hypothetical protein [Actinokineospora sp. PR83]
MEPRRSGSRRLITTLVAVALGVIALAAPASATAEPSTAQLSAAIDRVWHERATDADRALLARVPEVAKRVVDPAKTTVQFERGSGNRPTGELGTQTAQDEYNWAYVRVNYYSTLGFTVYSYRQYVEWYYNYNVVTAWKNRYDIVDYNDGTANFGAYLQNFANPPGGTVTSSVMQRQVHHCLATYGCPGWSYPYTQINVFSNGNATYSSYV